MTNDTIAPGVCDKPRNRPLGLWITLTGCPQPHRPNHHNTLIDTHEHNQKTVTHVVGLFCYPCPRLLKASESPLGHLRTNGTAILRVCTWGYS